MPMSFCSADDLALLKELSATVALIPFDGTRFQHYQACGLCSDGSRFHMKGYFPALCQQNGGGDSMMFEYKTHGTAMCFGLESPPRQMTSGGAPTCRSFGTLRMWLAGKSSSSISSTTGPAAPRSTRVFPWSIPSYSPS